MWKWVKELDRILRGDATRLPALRRGTIEVHLGGLSLVILLLGLIYGVCMGVFALLHPEGPRVVQTIATTVKVPALFFLTLLVTFPSLYVFNALVGSRLVVPAVLRLLIAAMAVTLAVLASFGPIVAFFSVCTTSHPFMVLLNVAVYTVAGLLGLKFLLMTLNRLSIVEMEQEADADPGPSPPENPGDAPPAGGEGAPGTGEELPRATPILVAPPGALERVTGHVFGRHVKAVFRCWVVVFGLVGAQMGWVLRPFIGDPDQPFTWFRARESSFFEAVWGVLVKLFS